MVCGIGNVTLKMKVQVGVCLIIGLDILFFLLAKIANNFWEQLNFLAILT